MTKPDLSTLKKDLVFTRTLRGREFTFHSTWGLFSPEKIDDGSYLIIEETKINPTDTVLDLGCGYGAMGITLAASTSGEVHCVDKDFVAVEYTKKNAETNGTGNVQTYLSNGFDQVPSDAKFDVIVSNLPAKVSKEYYWILFADAKARLKPGGTFSVVVISGLRDFIKRNFTELFGNYTKVAHNKTYTVISAQRTS